MSITLLVEILMVVLLGAVLVYAHILNRKLSAFRRNRAEVEGFVRAFGEATERAEGSIHRLKAIAEQTGAQLQDTVDRGRTILDELTQMTQHGDRIADRLERSASTATRSARAAPAGRGEEIIDDRPMRATEPRTERHAQVQAEALAARLAAVADGADPDEPMPEGLRGRPAPVEPDSDAGRSEAERDLLKALRSVR